MTNPPESSPVSKSNGVLTRRLGWKRLAWTAAGLGGASGCALYLALLMRQRSSTAALGILVLPLVFVIAGALAAALAFSLRAIVGAIREPSAGSSARALVGAVVLLLGVSLGLQTALQAARLQRLESEQTRPEALRAALELALEGRNYLDLAAIAGNPNTPPDVLMRLASSPDPGLHRKRAGCFQLLDRDALAVLRKVLRNPNLPAEAIPLIAESEDLYVLGDVAMNRATPRPLLRRLAEEHESYLVRWGLALNPETPGDILESLAVGESAKDEVIQRSLAQNEGTPPQVLERLAEHADPFVRRGVARNRRTPVASLRRLLEDEQEEVRFYLAINDEGHFELLEALTRDASPRVRAQARERLARLESKR